VVEPREVWITGIGIVSCLGEGLDAHWAGFSQPSAADTTAFAPYVVHRLATLALEKQLSKRDQRQMEQWQRIGTYAAGVALENAGLKGNAELLSRIDMIVAAGFGERETDADVSILSGMRNADDREAYLNRRLMDELKPTAFLTQLSNMMAGNISIVHGVSGSSRTFMGEEAAGVEAVRIAFARIAAGQSDIALLGGAYNAERVDLLLHHAMARHLAHDEHTSVWQRDGRGMEPGSLGAFLLLEERRHAMARGAKAHARIAGIESGHVERTAGALANALEHMWSKVAPTVKPGHAAILSGATGIEPFTSEEKTFLARHPDLAVRATGTHLGHGLQPQFPANIALAAMALEHRQLFPPADASFERPMVGQLQQVIVTSVGQSRGESLALIERVG
jgi:3-oxoacyl-[acyl-carrier-protein] synthase II